MTLTALYVLSEDFYDMFCSASVWLHFAGMTVWPEWVLCTLLILLVPVELEKILNLLKKTVVCQNILLEDSCESKIYFCLFLKKCI